MYDLRKMQNERNLKVLFIKEVAATEHFKAKAVKEIMSEFISTAEKKDAIFDEELRQ